MFYFLCFGTAHADNRFSSKGAMATFGVRDQDLREISPGSHQFIDLKNIQNATTPRGQKLRVYDEIWHGEKGQWKETSSGKPYNRSKYTYVMNCKDGLVALQGYMLFDSGHMMERLDYEDKIKFIKVNRFSKSERDQMDMVCNSPK